MNSANSLRKNEEREMYVKSFLVILAVLTFCASAWAGEVMVQQQDSSIVTAQREIKPFQPKQIEPIAPQQLKFDRYEHGDVEVIPLPELTVDPVLVIRWGPKEVQTTRWIYLGQGQERVLRIPENLLDSNGELPLTVQYKLRNTTTKRLRFRVGLWYGSNVIASKEVIFFGQQTKDIRHTAKIVPSSGYLSFKVEGLNILDYPDDTRPIFFNGRLWVRVYAL